MWRRNGHKGGRERGGPADRGRRDTPRNSHGGGQRTDPAELRGNLAQGGGGHYARHRPPAETRGQPRGRTHAAHEWPTAARGEGIWHVRPFNVLYLRRLLGRSGAREPLRAGWLARGEPRPPRAVESGGHRTGVAVTAEGENRIIKTPTCGPIAGGRATHLRRSTRRDGEELRAGMWRKDSAYSSSREGGACCGGVSGYPRPFAQLRKPRIRCSSSPMWARARARILSLLASVSRAGGSGRDLRLPAAPERPLGLSADGGEAARCLPLSAHREAALRMASMAPNRRSGSGGPPAGEGARGSRRDPPPVPRCTEAAESPRGDDAGAAPVAVDAWSRAEATDAVREESDQAAAIALERTRLTASWPSGGCGRASRLAGRRGGPMAGAAAGAPGGASEARSCAARPGN